MAKKSTNTTPTLISENTVIEITIPEKNVKTAVEKTLKRLQPNVKKDGFRKGKVPLSLVQIHYGREVIIQEALPDAVSSLYKEAIISGKYAPISQPEVTPIATPETGDWKVSVAFAQKPEISLTGYKKIVTQAKKGVKPDEGEQKKEHEHNHDHDHEHDHDHDHSHAPTRPETLEERQLRAIYQALVQNLKPQIPELLLKQETSQELQMLQYQLQGIKKSLQDYLNETGQTYENFATELTASVLGRLQLQHILGEIVTSEKLETTQAELEKQAQTHKIELGKASQRDIEYLQQLTMREKLTNFLLSL